MNFYSKFNAVKIMCVFNQIIANCVAGPSNRTRLIPKKPASATVRPTAVQNMGSTVESLKQTCTSSQNKRRRADSVANVSMIFFLKLMKFC